MNSFFSRPRTAIAPFFLLLAMGNPGCGGGIESGSHVAGAGGGGGAGGTGGESIAAACDSPDATDFAELTAPPGESFEEAVIAVTDTEVGLAYTRWHDETRDVTVYLQRFSLDGVALGDPALLHTFNESAGQLAAGDFYGRPTIATDGTRFLVCWGEAEQVGCAAVSAGSGEPTFHAIPSGESGFAYLPHVTSGPAGLRVFFIGEGEKPLTLALDEQANPVSAAAEVPGTVAAATDSGFAVVLRDSGTVFFLGPDLAPLGEGVATPGPVDGIAALAGAAVVVGARTVTRVDAGGQATSVIVAAEGESHRMAVVARESDAGVVWSSPDFVLRLTQVGQDGVAGPEKNAGCASFSVHPSIAAVADGYLVAAARPEGEHELFYARGYPRLRITHVAMP